MEEKKGLRNLFRGKQAVKDDAPHVEAGEIIRSSSHGLIPSFWGDA